MTRIVPASHPAAPPAPVRRKRGRHCVVVGTPPADWQPADPGDVPPDGLKNAEALASAVTLAQAIAEVRTFNHDAMRQPGGLWACILFRPKGGGS